MKNIKNAANQLKPFFLSNGFFRKGNSFVKIENCFLFLISFYHGYALTPEFQVIPLYYPYDMRTIPFGSKFREYKKHRIKFEDYYQVHERAIAYMVNKNEKSMDFDKWIHDVEEFCSTHIFPLMSRISSLKKMKSFLDMGLYATRNEWKNTTSVAYYNLKAYTHFVLEEYDEMKRDIKSGLREIDNYPVYNRIKEQWKSVLEILSEKKACSDNEKSEWLNNIVSNTLNIWLGKNWETIIKNKLTLPLDFSNC